MSAGSSPRRTPLFRRNSSSFLSENTKSKKIWRSGSLPSLLRYLSHRGGRPRVLLTLVLTGLVLLLFLVWYSISEIGVKHYRPLCEQQALKRERADAIARGQRKDVLEVAGRLATPLPLRKDVGQDGGEKRNNVIVSMVTCSYLIMGQVKTKENEYSDGLSIPIF